MRFDKRTGAKLGLVISGVWVERLGDWDLNEPFLVLSTDGEIQRCEGRVVEQVSVL